MVKEIISRVMHPLHRLHGQPKHTVTRELRRCYKRLGVPINASVVDIQIAYRERAWKFHPGRFDYDKRLEGRLKEMTRDLDRAYAKIMVHLGQRQGGEQLMLELK